MRSAPCSRAGFTLVEVMLASILLSSGVGAVLGTAALTIRMVHQGRQVTRAHQVASAELERLRGLASEAPALCGALPDGADSSSDGTAWQWRVSASGELREVVVTVSVPMPGGVRTDSLLGTIRCR